MAQLGDAAPKIVFLNSRGGTPPHGHLSGGLHERAHRFVRGIPSSLCDQIGGVQQLVPAVFGRGFDNVDGRRLSVCLNY